MKKYEEYLTYEYLQSALYHQRKKEEQLKQETENAKQAQTMVQENLVVVEDEPIHEANDTADCDR
jgi:hypothetical protein